MELTNERSLAQERTKIAVIILCGIVIFSGYKMYLNNRVREEGVYVKAEVVESEGNKGGVLTAIKYQFNGHWYKGRVNSPHGAEKIGSKYFLMLLPDDPKVITLLDTKPLPDCVIQMDQPPEGWKKIPDCK
jgi:hypothetical protein